MTHKFTYLEDAVCLMLICDGCNTTRSYFGEERPDCWYDAELDGWSNEEQDLCKKCSESLTIEN